MKRNTVSDERKKENVRKEITEQCLNSVSTNNFNGKAVSERTKRERRHRRPQKKM